MKSNSFHRGKGEIAIIGGGLSGLSAAVELAANGFGVTLFEKAPHLGGRCYSYIDLLTGDVIDNGQHVLIGANHSTLRYLKRIGAEHLLKRQKRLCLQFAHPEKGQALFQVQRLPKPLHLTAGMLRFSLLSLKEKKSLLALGNKLFRWEKHYENQLESMTIEQWLSSENQTENTKISFWYPIAISVMNEIPSRASALLFAKAIRSAFFGKISDIAILLPTVGQSELYVTRAIDYLRRNSANIYTRAEVVEIERVGKSFILKFKNLSTFEANYVICTVPYFSLNQILSDKLAKINSFSYLEKFKSSPIVSINLWYDQEFMDADFIGMINSNIQWLFNRRRIIKDVGKLKSYLTAIISGAHDIVNLPKEKIIALVTDDIRKIFPESTKARLLHTIVIKEKRATFSPTNEANLLRPNSQTEIPNFYLAGDWTNTGLPPTIEGAILSGFNSANALLKDIR